MRHRAPDSEDDIAARRDKRYVESVGAAAAAIRARVLEALRPTTTTSGVSRRSDDLRVDDDERRHPPLRIDSVDLRSTLNVTAGGAKRRVRNRDRRAREPNALDPRELAQLRGSIIHPRSRLYSAWWLAFTAFSVFAMLFTTTVIAFFDTNLIAVFSRDGQPGTGLSVAIIEVIIDVAWALDTALTFFVAFYKDGALVASQRAIAMHYVVVGSKASGSFVPDLLATVPIDTIVLACVSNPSENFAEYMSLFRLFRFFKLNKAVIFFELIQLRYHRFLVLITIVRLLATVLFIAHSAGCIFYYLARVENFSGDSWIGAGDDSCDASDAVDVNDTSTFARYVTSLYWSVTTLTTVGYGDITPESYIEQVFVVVYIIFNVLLLSYVSGTFTMMVIRKDEEISEYRDKQLSTLRFVRRHKLPRPVLISMQSFLRQQLASGDDVAGNTIFGALPPTLSSRVRAMLYDGMLAAIPLLESTSLGFRSELSSKLVVMNMSGNVELLSAGQAVSRFLILMEGAVYAFRTGESEEMDTIDVEVERADNSDGAERERQHIVDAPTVLGFAAFAAGRRSPSSAVTIRESVIGFIEKAEYDEIAAEYSADGLIVLENAIALGNKTGSGVEALGSSVAEARNAARAAAIDALLLCCARGDTSQLDVFASANVIDGDAASDLRAHDESEILFPSCVSDIGVSPLYVASYHGHLNVVSELLKRGAEVNPCVRSPELLPLFGAIAGNALDVIEELLRAGASLAQARVPCAVRRSTDDGGTKHVATTPMTTLHRLVLDNIQRGRTAALELLLECGADADGGCSDEADANGGDAAARAHGAMLVPPLHLACRVNDARAAALLLRYGATPTLRWRGSTAREIAEGWNSDACVNPALWEIDEAQVHTHGRPLQDTDLQGL